MSKVEHTCNVVRKKESKIERKAVEGLGTIL